MEKEPSREMRFNGFVKIICAIITALGVIIGAKIGGQTLVIFVGELFEKQKAQTLEMQYPESSFDPRDIGIVYSPTSQYAPDKPTQEIISKPSIQTDVPAVNQSSCGTDWVQCWEIDDVAKTLTWVGINDASADIGQAGEALYNIRMGYKAIFTISERMTINICQGQVDGNKVTGPCPVVQSIEPGIHEVISPGASGGFRVYK